MRKQKLCILFAICCIILVFSYVLVFQAVFLPATKLPLKQFEPFFDSQTNTDCSIGNLVYGNYCVISRHGEAERHSPGSHALTLCTQGTVEFLHHVVVLCLRWGGPISVAVYSPPGDLLASRKFVDNMMLCDSCIHHWVTWHFFARKEDTPATQETGESAAETVGDCLALSKWQGTKRQSLGSYPINVARNIARNRTTTSHVLSIDIELYPSTGVLQKFERMIRSTPNKSPTSPPEVWVLPVFEVNADSEAPRTKSQLSRMLESKQAISFHSYRCDTCHRIPNLTQWTAQDNLLKPEANDSLDYLRVWRTVKRSRTLKLQDWEPFFIGTRSDPEFDIRLSWEGKQNKMQVAYEMCMRNYNFHIVENAFLVHSPGVNVYNASAEKHRWRYLRANRNWITASIRDLSEKYGKNDDC